MALAIPLLAVAGIFTGLPGLPGVIAVCVALIAIAITAAR